MIAADEDIGMCSDTKCKDVAICPIPASITELVQLGTIKAEVGCVAADDAKKCRPLIYNSALAQIS